MIMNEPFHLAAQDEIPTLPPTRAELEALAEFELMIQAWGERDARYVHTSERLDSLLASQPEF